MNKHTNSTDRYIVTATKTIALLTLGGLVWWAGDFIWNTIHYEQTNDAQVEEYLNPVSTRVSGYIKKIYFEENQEVNAGDTLLVIDKDEFVDQQAESEAAGESAKAQIPVLESRLRTLKMDAGTTASQIDAAKAKMLRQQKEFQRYKNLLAEESTTQQQFDNIKTALDMAESDYRTAVNAHDASLARAAEIMAQEAAAFAEIKRRDAILSRNRLDVGYTVIRAPYKGKIGRKGIQEGQFVQAGQSLAFIVNGEAGKWIVANFKETQVRKFAVGKKADITIDAFPGDIFHGEIESVSPATGSRYSLLPPDNATGNFVKIIQRIPVRIKITDAPTKVAVLTAGMNANVSINN